LAFFVNDTLALLYRLGDIAPWRLYPADTADDCAGDGKKIVQCQLALHDFLI
jgi:hypothetical protein